MTTRPRSKILSAGARSDRRRRIMIQCSVTAALVGLIVLIGINIAMKKATNDTDAAAPTVATSDSAIKIGEPDSPVTVTVYEDLQCPMCALLERRIDPVLTEFIETGTISVDYHIAGLLDGYSRNKYASRAANASWAVAQNDLAAWPRWHTAMFEQQPPEGTAGPADDELAEQTRQLGITAPEVEQAIMSGTYRRFVDQHAQQLIDDGINSVPRILINGQPLADPSPSGLKAAITAAQHE